VQERRAVEPYLHERRLHPGQHARYRAIVDIADQAPARRPLDEDLLQHAVFEQRRPDLGRRHVNQDLFFS
jgi:hypothetical protein